ncbi:MAG: energy-coupling factor transport system substrate-specific component [Clostridium sp.]|jgi:energy-coupling factor transport system substrate-specific component
MYFTFLIPILLIMLGIKYKSYINMSLSVTLAVFLIIFLSYFYFEKSSMGTKEIAVIATLSVFAAISRIPFSAILNVQPTTFLVALSGLVFGPYEGFLVGSTAAFISNIFLGQGPYTPWQMLAWGIVGAISGLIGKRGKKLSVEKFAVICFAYGFLFDWIMNLWQVLIILDPISIKGILTIYITSVTADIMHAVGNFVFALIFYESFYKVLTRFKNKLEITYIKNIEKL